MVPELPRPVVPYVSLLESVDIVTTLNAILEELKKLNTQTEDVVANTSSTVSRLDFILLDTTEIAAAAAGIAIEVAAIAIDTTAIAATELDIAANTSLSLAAQLAIEGTVAAMLGIETNIKSDTADAAPCSTRHTLKYLTRIIIIIVTGFVAGGGHSQRRRRSHC